VAALGLAAVGLQALRTTLLTTDSAAFPEPGWDHHAYIGMARDNPFDFHLVPFGWRFLVPLVAKVLPFGLQTSFFLIAFTCTWAASVVVYYLGRAVGGTPVYGALAAALFVALPWAAKFALQDFWLPDAAVFVALAGAVLCGVRKKPVAFAVVLLVGVAAKESVIFAAPLYYTLNTERLLDRRLLGRTALLVLPAGLLLVAVRLLIPAKNDDLAYVATLPTQLQAFREYIPSYHYYDLLRDIGYHGRLHDHRLDTLLAYTTGTWGVGVLTLAGIGAVRRPVLALRLSPFLVLVYAQLLFAWNIERLLVAGFPAVIWLALEGMKTLCERGPLRPGVFLPLAIALFALNLRDPDLIPVRFEVQAVVFLAYVAVLLGWPTTRQDAATGG